MCHVVLGGVSEAILGKEGAPIGFSLNTLSEMEWSCFFGCLLSTVVVQLICNEQVIGSNPIGGSFLIFVTLMQKLPS